MVASLAPPAAGGADKVFDGATDNTWATSANWDPDGVPAASESAAIGPDATESPGAGNFDVTLDNSGNEVLAAWVFDQSTLTIDSGGELTVDGAGNSSDLRVTGNAGVTLDAGTLNVRDDLFFDGVATSFTMTGGTLQEVAGSTSGLDLTILDNTTASVTGGTLLVSDDLRVKSTSTFTFDNANLDVAGSMVLGDLDTDTPSMDLNGGTVDITEDFENRSAGDITIDGATVTTSAGTGANNYFRIRYSGAVRVRSGSLDVNFKQAGNSDRGLIMGLNGSQQDTPTLVNEGGSIDIAGSLVLRLAADDAYAGVFRFSGGSSGFGSGTSVGFFEQASLTDQDVIVEIAGDDATLVQFNEIRTDAGLNPIQNLDFVFEDAEDDADPFTAISVEGDDDGIDLQDFGSVTLDVDLTGMSSNFTPAAILLFDNPTGSAVGGDFAAVTVTDPSNRGYTLSKEFDSASMTDGGGNDIALVLGAELRITDVAYDPVLDEFTLEWISTLPGPFTVEAGDSTALETGVFPETAASGVTTSPVTFAVPAALTGEDKVFVRMRD